MNVLFIFVVDKFKFYTSWWGWLEQKWAQNIWKYTSWYVFDETSLVLDLDGGVRDWSIW
jgi:hypothetical protein